MGRDISEKTYKTEKSLRDRRADCELDNGKKAHFIQAVYRTRDIDNVSDSDMVNRVGCVDYIRVCAKHNVSGYKDAVILAVVPFSDISMNEVIKNLELYNW